MSDEKRNDPALEWAADRAGLPYDRFVRGLTPATIARIKSAYAHRYVYDATVPGQPPVALESLEAREERLRFQIGAAFQEKMSTLPQEIRPEAYEQFLEDMDVHSKWEKEILSAVVKEELGKAQLAVTRQKLNHFLWWLGGQ